MLLAVNNLGQVIASSRAISVSCGMVQLVRMLGPFPYSCSSFLFRVVQCIACFLFWSMSAGILA
jgi:hypothetical protein